MTAGRADMLRAEVGGLSIAYRQARRGLALALLHGFSLRLACGVAHLDAFSAEFNVIAWTAPGAGRSSDPPDTLVLGDCADCLATPLESADDEHGVVDRRRAPLVEPVGGVQTRSHCNSTDPRRS